MHHATSVVFFAVVGARLDPGLLPAEQRTFHQSTQAAIPWVPQETPQQQRSCIAKVARSFTDTFRGLARSAATITPLPAARPFRFNNYRSANLVNIRLQDA